LSSSGFENLIKDLGHIASSYEGEAKDFMKQIELEVVANTQLNTKVVSGNLKRSWTFEEPVKEGNTITGTIGSDYGIAPYAEAVEFGHETNGGGFVSGQFTLKKEVEKMDGKYQARVEKFYEDLAKRAGL